MAKPVKIEVLADAASVERAQKAVENLQATVARDAKGRFLPGAGGAGGSGGGSDAGFLNGWMEKRAEGLAASFGALARRAGMAALAMEGVVATVGIRFNASIDNATISIAAMLNQLAPERFNTLRQGIGGATTMIRGLRKEALTTTATFGDLVQSSQTLLAPALAAGISVDKIPALAAMISRTVSTIMPGAPGVQMGQEGRALLTGQIGPDAQVAKSLGITSDQIKTAIKTGNLFEFLESRMRAFNTASELSAKTLTGLASTLQDNLTDVMGTAFEGAHDALRSLVQTLVDFTRGDSFKRLMALAGKLAEGAISGAEASIPALQMLLSSDFSKLAMGIVNGTINPDFLPKHLNTNGSYDDPIGPPVPPGFGKDGKPNTAGDKYLSSLILSALMPSRGGLASRGLFASFSDWQSNSQALNVAQSQLDTLRAIRDQLNKGLKIEEIGGFA